MPGESNGQVIPLPRPLSYGRAAAGGEARESDETMTAEKKFEARFEGPANKGLRAKIRRLTNAAGSCPAAAAAVRGLAKTVALTASGKATLEQVARDYDPQK